MVKDARRFDEEYDVAVIGAGIGGLTCAAYLAGKGKKVKVFEQHFVPGGCCTSFSRKGFKFDAGVLHLTGGKESGAFQKVMAALGMEQELEFKEQFQRFVFPDFTYDSTRNVDDYPDKLKEMFPEEAGGITKLFDTINSIYEDIKRLPALSPLLRKYREKSYQDLIDEHIKDTKLKALVNANWHLWNPVWKNSAVAVASLTVSETLRGYFYPVGGT